MLVVKDGPFLVTRLIIIAFKKPRIAWNNPNPITPGDKDNLLWAGYFPHWLFYVHVCLFKEQ